MSAVRSKDTQPELIVRKLAHKLGYRFRLYRKDLPGKPDLVFPKYRVCIFLHGCFWHQHKGCKRSARPKTNTDFWNTKLDKNVERDQRIKKQLEKLGWKVVTIWECQIKNQETLRRIISDALKKNRFKRKM